MEFALAGLFVAFTGAGVAGILLLALIAGTLIAVVFGVIFYAMNRLGKRASRQFAPESKLRLNRPRLEN